MAFWALELAKAFDHSLECPECNMSFYANDHESCPYCCEKRPSFIRAKTSRWEIVIPSSAKGAALPHRLFHPFSFEYQDDIEYEAVLDFTAKSAFPIRGTKAFPDNLTFDFVGVGK